MQRKVACKCFKVFHIMLLTIQRVTDTSYELCTMFSSYVKGQVQVPRPGKFRLFSNRQKTSVSGILVFQFALWI